MATHRPIDVSDERLWLLGFALVVMVPIVAAVCWFGVPVGTAEMTVDGPINATV
jgi:hypothetical protein